MSVLVTGVVGMSAGEGDQIAAFDATGRLAGVGNFNEDGAVGLAVWGDNNVTEQVVEGMIDGETFTLKVWDSKLSAERNAAVGASRIVAGDIKIGTDEYELDRLVVMDLSVASAIPTNYYLAQNFPNPFNAVTRVTYGLPEAAKVAIRVYDLAGRLVTTLAEGEMKAGHHVAVWNGSEIASGVYLIKMETPAYTHAIKSVLVK